MLMCHQRWKNNRRRHRLFRRVLLSICGKMMCAIKKFTLNVSTRSAGHLQLAFLRGTWMLVKQVNKEWLAAC
jgi:hypothetical protein